MITDGRISQVAEDSYIHDNNSTSRIGSLCSNMSKVSSFVSQQVLYSSSDWNFTCELANWF